MQNTMKTGKKIFLSQARLHIPTNKIIVFWDTCALLDIIRIPIRDNLKFNDLVCYERIAQYINNDNIISVTSGLVIKEFADHYQNERRNLIQAQTKLKNQVLDYTNYMISTNKKNRITSAINLLNVESRLDTVLNQILKKTFVLKEEAIYRDFADYRLRNKIAPAARKSEYKDCYIWGTFIKLVHKISPTSNYVSFISVNTKDYQDDNGRLHSHIQTDCNYLNSMKVVFNIGKLYGDLSAELGF